MSYRFLEHTSDIIIEGEEKSFEKALEEVAKGMITQMGAETTKKKRSIKIEIPSRETKEDIVVEVLTQIIATCEAEGFTPSDVSIKIGKKITVKLSGEKKIPKNIIKAVTYHNLKIEKNRKWKITVLFDI